MLDFRYAKISDRERISELLSPGHELGCDYCFGTMYLWQKHYVIKVAESDGCLLVRMREDGECFYLVPVGENRAKAVEALKREAAEKGEELLFVSVCEDDRAFLENNFPGEFCFEEERDGFEYIYDVNDLADLAGRKYHGKKNHVNRFIKDNPDWSFEELGPGNIEECRALEEEWESEKTDSEGEDTRDAEADAISACFDEYNELKLDGGVLRTGGRVVAFTVGEMMPCGDTCDIHYEKALANVSGAYSMINYLFAGHLRNKYPNIKYINREEDLGLEGIRAAKESYHPLILLKKYIARQR